LHYADYFPEMRHARLEAPFTPERYTEAIKAGVDAGFGTIVVDSASHEWEGVGGVLELQEEWFRKLGGRDSVNMLSWAHAKKPHKRFMQFLLQQPAHIILCFRAEDKIEIVKVNGETVVRPKASLTGLDGWIPICEKRMPYELTLSLLFTPDAKGIPKVIKLEGHHEPMVPLDRQLGEQSGKALAAWAAGAGAGVPPEGTPAGEAGEATSGPALPLLATEDDRRLLFGICRDRGIGQQQMKAILQRITSQESTSAIPADKVDEISAALTAAEPEGEAHAD
jgi:hypothetical protein